jgi:hypothetical protein
MKLLSFIMLLSCGPTLVVCAAAKDNPDSAALQDFTRRVLGLRKGAPIGSIGGAWFEAHQLAGGHRAL